MFEQRPLARLALPCLACHAACFPVYHSLACLFSCYPVHCLVALLCSVLSTIRCTCFSLPKSRPCATVHHPSSSTETVAQRVCVSVCLACDPRTNSGDRSEMSGRRCSLCLRSSSPLLVMGHCSSGSSSLPLVTHTLTANFPLSFSLSVPASA